MNAVTLTVVALLYSSGEIWQVEIKNDHLDMTSCLEAAANVIEMDNVLAFDCQWITVDENVWRMAFGDKIQMHMPASHPVKILNPGKHQITIDRDLQGPCFQWLKDNEIKYEFVYSRSPLNSPATPPDWFWRPRPVIIIWFVTEEAKILFALRWA